MPSLSAAEERRSHDPKFIFPKEFFCSEEIKFWSWDRISVGVQSQFWKTYVFQPEIRSGSDVRSSESPCSSTNIGPPVSEANPLPALDETSHPAVPPPFATGARLDNSQNEPPSESLLQSDAQASAPQPPGELGDSLFVEPNDGSSLGDISPITNDNSAVSQQQTVPLKEQSGSDPEPTSRAQSHRDQGPQTPKTWHELEGPLKVHQSVLLIFLSVLVLLTFTTTYVLAFSFFPRTFYEMIPPSGSGSLFLLQTFTQVTQGLVFVYTNKTLEAVFWARVSSERGTTLSSMLAMSPGTDVLGLWDLYGWRWRSEGDGRSNTEHSTSRKNLIPLLVKRVAKLLLYPLRYLLVFGNRVHQP
jgi:hypothetical protein